MTKEMKISRTEYTVKVYNQREEKLVRMINTELDILVEYNRKRTFGERTINVIRRNVEEINGMLNALFYMGLASDPMVIDENNIINA